MSEQPSRRGRKSNAQKAAEAHEANRPARVPMGIGQKLTLPSFITDAEKGMYEHRWCLDDQQGSIEQYEQAWWDYVVSPDGDKVRRPAGNGKYLYLMRLPQKIYKEDMELQEKKNIDTLKKEVKLEEGDYIPNDQEFVVQKGV